MRWSATPLLITVLPVLLVGCQEPKNEQDMQAESVQSTMMTPDYYTTDPAAGGSDATFAGGYPADTTGPALATAASGSIHVVAKGDTLFGLARHYYNDQRRWKDIWDANHSAVSNPDLIHIGQELVIP